MSKAKKKKIKQRKCEARKFQRLAEKIATAITETPMKSKRNLARMIKS